MNGESIGQATCFMMQTNWMTYLMMWLTGPKLQTFKCVNCVNFTVNCVNSYCFSQFVSHFVVVTSITPWPT